MAHPTTHRPNDQPHPLRDASWIGTPLEGHGKLAPPVPAIRRLIDLAEAPKSARLTVTALGCYEGCINGQRVGDLELQPGWTEYATRVYYQRYDVTDLLKSGQNAIGFYLGDGWYSGRVGWMERGMRWGQRPFLMAALEIQDSNETRRWVTNENWQWRPSPILSSDLMDGEHHNGPLEASLDWHSDAEDPASPWSPVRVETPDVAPEHLLPAFAPPVRVTEELSPVEEPRLMKRGNQRAWIFDFGQNFAGKVRLKLRGPKGATVTLRYAEVLTPDGEALDTSNLRSAVVTDTYALTGNEEPDVWTPKFTFHGFRYAELSCKTRWTNESQKTPLGPVDRDTLTGLVMHNDIRRIGEFTTGHDLLNQLQSNIEWGLRSNFLEVPTDCPQRDERLGWTGDIQVFGPTASRLFDVKAFLCKWLDDLADSQMPTGEVPSVAPNPLGRGDSAAGWSDATVVVPWTLYRSYGDAALLERHFPMMSKWIDFQIRTAVDGVRGSEASGIFRGHGDWLALDNDSINPMDTATSLEFVGTAYHAYSLGVFARVAEVLGESVQADNATKARQVAVDAFNREFVKDGKLTAQSQTGHLFALAFDLVSDELRKPLFDRLLELIDERGGHLSTGFLGTPLLCDVLTDAGRIDRAFDLLLTETYPGWLFPVTLGATTMWERWNSWHPEKGFVDLSMNSLNHYAYGAVGDWMYRRVGGIDLDHSRGADDLLRLSPNPDRRLGHASVSLQTPEGKLSSSWQYQGNAVHYAFSIPDGLEATLVLPGEKPERLAAGDHSMQRDSE